MIKSLVSIVIAAACAAVFVGFVPPPAPAVAAAQSPQQPVTSAVKPVAAAGPVADIHNAGCVQAWPYYEQSCLHPRCARHSRQRACRDPHLESAALGLRGEADASRIPAVSKANGRGSSLHVADRPWRTALHREKRPTNNDYFEFDQKGRSAADYVGIKGACEYFIAERHAIKG
jgi:hypothetical protein